VGAITVETPGPEVMSRGAVSGERWTALVCSDDAAAQFLPLEQLVETPYWES